MSVEEELSYWDKYFTAPRDAQEAKQEVGLGLSLRIM